MGKVNSNSTGKVWENTEIMQTYEKIMRFNRNPLIF